MVNLNFHFILKIHKWCSHTFSGSFNQAAPSNHLWKRRRLEKCCSGFSWNSPGNRTEVSEAAGIFVSSTVMHMLFPGLKTTFISSLRQYNVDYKLDTYLKIARLYLEDDDPVQAEAYINRASLLQNESSNEQLQIHYKVFIHLMIAPLQRLNLNT